MTNNTINPSEFPTLRLHLAQRYSSENIEDELVYSAKLSNNDIFVEFDTGASDLFMSEQVAKALRLKIIPENQEVELGDSSKIWTIGYTTAQLQVGETNSTTEHIFIVNTPAIDVRPDVHLILGRSWGRKTCPEIDWTNSSIKITREDGSISVIRSRNYKNSSKKMKMMSFKKMLRVIKRKQGEVFRVKLSGSAEKANINDNYKGLVSEFQDVFSEDLPNNLPPERDIEFEINLKPGSTPPVRPVIRLTQEELVELRKQLDNLLKRKLIRPSNSPFGAPVFFVK